jgi:methyl-accepting chemotaxis protein
MHVLSHLRLRTKLAALMGLSAIALIATVAVASSLLHQRMIDDRVDKLRAVVQTAQGLAQSLENQVIKFRMSRRSPSSAVLCIQSASMTAPAISSHGPMMAPS